MVGEYGGAAGDGGTVAAGLADHRRRFARDRRFVDRGDAFDDFAVAGNDVAGLDQNDVADAQVERVHRLEDIAEILGIDITFGARIGARLAQRVGLGLAAAFRHRFGEIGEQHREPQPESDLAGKQRRTVLRENIADEKAGDDQRDDFGDEDDRILGQFARIELAQGVDRRGADDRRIEQSLSPSIRGHG